jgi:predicted permease
METLFKDIRFGLRMFAQKPGFTAVAILTIALGIGANTAIFTLFDSVLLESLPVRQPSRLALFSDAVGEGTSIGTPPTNRWQYFSVEVYNYLRKQPLPFESLAAFRSGEDPVSVRLANAANNNGPAERARAHLVSGNYFQAMGVDAAMGRTLGPDDDRPNAAPVTVASYGYWKQNLHADPQAVGKTVYLNGAAFTIVGVTPPEFFGERVRRPPDFWMPLVFQPQIELRPSFLDRTDTYWLFLVGRLSGTATRAQAQAAATTSLRQFLTNQEGSKLTPDRKREIENSRIQLEDGAGGISGLRFSYSQPLQVLLGVVALVLLIACANVGNLLLSRAAARQTEVSVRRALGATRPRLVRQLLTESVLLASIGAACGILLARWAVDALVTLLAKNSPMKPHLNGPVLAFTVGVTLVAGILFGLAPALYAGRADLVSTLKSGGRSVTGGRKKFGATQALIIAQIAVSLVLLVGANLFARSLLNLENQPLGFDQARVLLARVNPRLANYKPDSTSILYRKIYDRVSVLPGVRAATLASYSPMSGSTSTSSISILGRTPQQNENSETEGIFVGPSYPESLSIPLMQGREIGLQDGPGAQKVAMVNQAFVKKYFPNENPIGHRFGYGDAKSAGDYEIIGVLRDAQFHDAKDPVKPIAYAALLQDSSQFSLAAELAVRTSGDPAAVASAVRQAVNEVDPNLPVSQTDTLSAQVANTFNVERVAAELVSFFGILALILASVGLYGVVAQSVSRRTNEIGIRVALGAQRGEIFWMILRNTAALVAAGLAIGIPVALGASRFVKSQLYNVGAADPLSFAAAALVLAAVAAFAGFLPARRATKVDPMVALRYE